MATTIENDEYDFLSMSKCQMYTNFNIISDLNRLYLRLNDPFTQNIFILIVKGTEQ